MPHSINIFKREWRQEFLSGKPAWQEKGKLGKGSLIYADGRLYCRTEDKGTMALLEPTPSAYKEISRFEQPDRSRPDDSSGCRDRGSIGE